MACYEPWVTRDDDIAAIVELGRRTRRPTPRWLWIAAAIVGVVCATGFAIVLLADPEPVTAHREPAGGPGESGTSAPGARGARGAPGPRGAPASWVRSGRHRAGLVTGLALGVVIGIVIGVAIGRQRSHSSRSRP